VSATLLLVDDDPGLSDAVRMVLEDEGYEVICAANGQEALKKAESHAIDLILLDLTMPIMNGYEFCEVRKQTPHLLAIPVILWTAGLPDARMQALGAAKIFRKPVSAEVLLDAISDTVAASRTQKNQQA